MGIGGILPYPGGSGNDVPATSERRGDRGIVSSAYDDELGDAGRAALFAELAGLVDAARADQEKAIAVLAGLAPDGGRGTGAG